MSGVTTATAIGLAIAVAGAAASAYSAYAQGQSASKAASANAAIQNQNAENQRQAGIIAENQGADAAAIQQQKARAANATLRASAGSNGLVSDTGTLGQLQDQNAEMGEFNALTTRNDAARQAWGYSVNASNATNQANLDTFTAQQDNQNSYISGGANLITGLGKAYTMLPSSSNMVLATSGPKTGQYVTPTF